MVTYTAWGFDFAYGNGITAAQLVSNGTDFVCRYLSTVGNTKNVSAAEVKNYKAAGINVVFNFETTGKEVSQAQGVIDAASAQAQLAAIAVASGIPAVATAPIIFSCDVQPSASVEADAVAYMRGVASVLGYGRSGVYGGYGTIQAVANAGVCKYFWQTYAWSNNEWDSRAQLQQYQNSVTVGPMTADRDRATAADYGQCQWDATATPPAAPPAASQAPLGKGDGNEYEGNCMELKTGKGAKDAIRFPVWPSALFFLADPSGSGAASTAFTVAFYDGAATWDVKTYTLTTAAPEVNVGFPVDGKNISGVVITRLDDFAGPVACSWR